MTAPLLSTRNLRLAIGERILCRGLDLDVHAGQCWGLLGQNGAGKTTLLHTLAGLRSGQGGEIRLGGTPIDELPRRDVARRLGLMPQDSIDAFPATVLETALIGRHPHLSRWQWESPRDLALARDALRRTGLAGMEARPVSTLSGGERRRLALATLLVQAPPLMLLDEPANHLDLRHQHDMLGLLRDQARAGHAVLMVLHDINHALRYCDHVVLLFAEGKPRHGPAGVLLEPALLSELYQHPVSRIQDGQHSLFVAE
ncbi:MAG TPA: ABC transporter ATP-binding protein [Chromatiales bacterium]|nr:ABC transporter ATP-binding protein [Chromatiales bacterium]